MALNNVDVDTIYRIVTMAKFLQDHRTDVLDLKKQFDAPLNDPVAPGLKARLQELPDDGLAELQLIYPALTSVAEFFDVAFIITALVGDAVSNGQAALAAVRKF